MAVVKQFAPEALREMGRPVSRPVKQSAPKPQEFDRELADRMLKHNRTQRPIFKSFFRRRSVTTAAYDKPEIYALMENMVRTSGGGAAGPLSCLLQMYGEVNHPKGLTQAQTAYKLLHLAIEQRNWDIVCLLCDSYVAQNDLDNSLGLALQMRDLECVPVLLQYGTDPNTYANMFLDAVKQHDVPIVEIFLNADKPLESVTLDAALSLAVSQKSLKIISLLFKHGANADTFPVLDVAITSSVIEGAVIDSTALDITAAFILADQPPSPLTLDLAIDSAFRATSTPTVLQLMITELLLCAGARGPTISTTLTKAVIASNLHIIDVIVRCGGSVIADCGESIIVAARNANLDALQFLLSTYIDPTTASRILSFYPEVSLQLPLTHQWALLSKLVESGANGKAVDNALIHVVEYGDASFIDYLIDHQASVNHEGNRVLSFAIRSGSSALLTSLLRGNPSRESLRKCFVLLKLLPLDKQRLLALVLLSTNITGPEIDTAMAETVENDHTYLKHELVREYVQQGANVNVNDGQCFRRVVSTGDIALLDILLDGSPSRSSLAKGIIPACGLPDPDQRMRMLDMLLSAGARGPLVDQGFLFISTSNPSALDMIELLLEKGEADVNVENGRVLHRATSTGNTELLSLLLRYKPSVFHLANSFTAAIELSNPDVRYKICSQFLTAGLKGWPIDRGLIDVQQNSGGNMALFELLLEHSTDINYSNGAAIRRTVQLGDVGKLRLLLTKQPSSDVLFNMLRDLIILEPDRKCEICHIILAIKEGDMNELLSPALEIAVKLQREVWLLQALLDYGTDINYDDGNILMESVNLKTDFNSLVGS